eukprot:jgi/Hompol1/6853/HPOL_000363-RA
MLLETDLKKDKNALLQCIRYIVQTDFLTAPLDAVPVTVEPSTVVDLKASLNDLEADEDDEDADENEDEDADENDGSEGDEYDNGDHANYNDEGSGSNRHEDVQRNTGANQAETEGHGETEQV